MSRLVGSFAAVLAALALAPAAFADGGPLPAVQGGPGLLGNDGSLRYVAVPSGGGGPNGTYTTLEAIRTSDGQLRSWDSLLGSWGLPTFGLGYAVANSISADGKTIVLAEPQLAATSKFLVLDARTLRLKNWVVLHGSFSFDALSPDSSKVFLIQYTLRNDYSHYVVRAYDLRRNALVPGRIADRTQKGWVMAGYPLTRTTSAGGRWVYTLYQNPGGYPFIHALDTVRGVAHCVGLPFSGSQNGLYNVVLTLHHGGRTLAVHWRSGRPWFDVDTASWRVAAARPAGFSWRWVAVGLGGAALVGLLLVPLGIRLRRPEGTRLAAAA